MTISDSDYDARDALGLAELVRARQVSAEELLEVALDRVAAPQSSSQRGRVGLRGAGGVRRSQPGCPMDRSPECRFF